MNTSASQQIGVEGWGWDAGMISALDWLNTIFRDQDFTSTLKMKLNL